jgi:hypothetical protein
MRMVVDFARAVGPEHRDELARRDVDVERAHGVHGPVAAGEVLAESRVRIAGWVMSRTPDRYAATFWPL